MRGGIACFIVSIRARFCCCGPCAARGGGGFSTAPGGGAAFGAGRFAGVLAMGRSPKSATRSSMPSSMVAVPRVGCSPTEIMSGTVGVCPDQCGESPSPISPTSSEDRFAVVAESSLLAATLVAPRAGHAGGERQRKTARAQSCARPPRRHRRRRPRLGRRCSPDAPPMRSLCGI